LILDFGNARIKWFDPRTNLYGDCRHAIVELSENDWQSVVGRGRPPEGYLRVNNVPFVIGDMARRYLIPERPQGASRYRANYYGVALGWALSSAFNRSSRNVTLVATHAPRDIKYARNLVAAACGEWHIENQDGEFDFVVRDVHTLDEPLGGYAHFVFTEKGMERRNNPLSELITLVVDIGGFTVDTAAIDPGGVLDPKSLKSRQAGVIEMMGAFEAELRGNNATLFQDDVRDLDVRKLEDALLSGYFRYGKMQIDCRGEAGAAINSLVNDVVFVINSAGGIANYDTILLTGGGAALIYDALSNALPRAEFLLAEKDRSLMKYANVFGGAKLAAALRLQGMW
jgi:hypothetical protein